MHCARFAGVLGAFGFLVACSGRYDVGQDPAGSRGFEDTNSGTGSTVTLFCGQTLPTSNASVAFASTDVVWNRIQLFLGSASAVPMPTGLPATMTRDLAGMLTDNTLAWFENESAPGLERFASSWWPGTSNAGAWGTLFGDSKATLTDLLTTNAVLNPGSGVLTDPAVLKLDEITARGKYIDEHLLCEQVPPPPLNTPALGPAQPGQTRREQLEQALAGPSPCATCHMLMDPIGDSLENYDSVGAFSKLDNGSPIDSSGALPLSTALGGKIGFADVNELGRKLAQQCEVAQCLTQQLLADAETSAKLPVAGSGDPQQVAAIASAASGGKLRDLIDSIVESDAFLRAE